MVVVVGTRWAKPRLRLCIVGVESTAGPPIPDGEDQTLEVVSAAACFLASIPPLALAPMRSS